MDPAVVYDARRHSAVRTDDYIFSQLIPYLGNKRKLLPLIAEAVALTGVAEGVFGDLFAGSGVVSRWAKTKGYRVVSNDWEPYTRPLGHCYVGLNAPPSGALDRLDLLNALPPEPGFLTEHFCPSDDHQPHPDAERCFYTRANGARLDAMRERIATWEADGSVDPATIDYLLASMIYTASYVSNTSGVFKAYHNGWGGQTRTALYRILSDARLAAPILCDNGRENLALTADAHAVAERWRDLAGGEESVVYIDPPYNQHPYGSNYHLLNTVALWDKPDVPPIRRGTKSAIRLDWRTDRRSLYNKASCALGALLGLVDVLPTRWVVLSYSTDGNMPVEPLLTALAERGETRLVTKRYKRYRVSAQRKSPRPHTVEFALVLDKENRRGSFPEMAGDGEYSVKAGVDEQLRQLEAAKGESV